MTFEKGQSVEARRGLGHTGSRRTGTVVAVSRKYCKVEFRGLSLSSEYDKETGVERGDKNYPQSLGVIKTHGQWAAVDRSFALREALRALGIELGYGCLATTEQVESIAAVMGVNLAAAE